MEQNERLKTDVDKLNRIYHQMTVEQCFACRKEYIYETDESVIDLLGEVIMDLEAMMGEEGKHD